MTVVWQKHSFTIAMVLLFHHTAVHAERIPEEPPPSYTEIITGIQEQGYWNADGTYTYKQPANYRPIAHDATPDSSRGQFRKKARLEKQQSIEEVTIPLKKAQEALKRGETQQAHAHMTEAEKALGDVEKRIEGTDRKHTFFRKKAKKTRSSEEALALSEEALKRVNVANNNARYGSPGDLEAHFSHARKHLQQAQQHLKHKEKRANKQWPKSDGVTSDMSVSVQKPPAYKRYWPQSPMPRMF